MDQITVPTTDPLFDLTDQVTPITGGGRGPGRATAKVFAARGPHMVIGFSHEYSAHLYHRRARSAEPLFGDTTHWRELPAQRLGL
ncbi:hypothetical protein [Streptosporangium sp. NPDC002607]